MLIEAITSLTKSEIAALDVTTWSSISSSTSPNVWSVLCVKLGLASNDNNKKWLSHVWQTNMWSVADAVRKYVTICKL